MRKISIVLLSTILLLMPLSACSNGTNASQGDTEETIANDVEEPESTFGNLKWPKSELANLIPQPKSSVGEVEWEAHYGFEVSVGEITQDQYNDYVDEVYDSGFNIDYVRSKDVFYGKNTDHVAITLEYEDDNIMRVFMEAVGELEETTTEETTTEETTTAEITTEETTTEATTQKVTTTTTTETTTKATTTDSSLSEDTIREDVKEAIDSYEEFYDGYIEFLESYDATDLTMLTKYFEWIKDLNEMEEFFEEIEDWDLTLAEYDYYIDTSIRILEKLSKIE